MNEWIWKRILKRRYLRFVRIEDTMHGGNAMASYMSLRYVDAKASVNRAIRKLNEINPETRLKEIP